MPYPFGVTPPCGCHEGLHFDTFNMAAHHQQMLDDFVNDCLENSDLAKQFAQDWQIITTINHEYVTEEDLVYILRRLGGAW